MEVWSKNLQNGQQQWVATFAHRATGEPVMRRWQAVYRGHLEFFVKEE